MNKHLHNSLRALFLSLAVLLSLPMLAEEVEIKEIYYDLNVETKQAAVVRIYSSLYQGEIVIPEYVEHKGATYSVTSIGNEAFLYCSVTSVTIGNSVESIGSGAFKGCSGLTSVTIGNSVESIGERAFDGCSGLTSVHISDIAAWCNIDFVSRYYSNPLYYAHHLYLNGEEVKDLVIPNSVTSIGGEAFFGCFGLTSVTIPNSVTSIGEDAFSYCSSLTSVHISDIAAWCNIDFFDSYSNPLSNAHHLYLNGEEVKDLVIPSSVTSIGDLAFYYCSGLTSVTIGNSVTSIGSSAFYWCSGLTSVTIGNSVTSIGKEAFCGCFALTSVTIPNSVTSIGDGAFCGCYGLTSVTIPNSVTSIGGEAFFGCFGLTSVTIGNSVESIGVNAFEGCSGLTSVTIGNSVTSIGGAAFAYCSGLTSVTIPNSVTSIGVLAFYRCSGLTSVTIPNSVTSIGSSAFSGCSGLTSVTIPNSVTSIGYQAFEGCHFVTENFVNNSSLSAEENKYWGAALHDYETEDGLLIDSTNVAFCRKSANIVTIPNSVTSIGSYAFYGCSGLTSVTIGSSVKSIGEEAFANCSELLDVYCYAEKAPSTESDAFNGSYIEYATLHVPDASIISYRKTEPWSRFRKIVAITDEETGIDELKGENGNVKTEIYDLSGRRVQKAQKGIFIRDGKVVVK